MQIFKWNAEKNEVLARERGITFEEIVKRIELGAKIIETDHPNKKKYPNQKILIIDVEGYAYLVPCVIDLDEYEKEILEAYENGKLKPSKPRADYQTIARNTMKKNRKINIRISENDLSALQRRAAREGIPYQTLIGSVLHKYASGFLKEAR